MLESLSLLSLVLSICVIVGGYIAVRQGFSHTAGEAQERAINALESEMDALHSRIEVLEHENTRLEQIITTICAALKQRGMHITIDGTMVSIRNSGQGETTCTTSILGMEQREEEHGRDRTGAHLCDDKDSEGR
jgi:uncharacterized protein (UPF0335 family)